MVVETGRLPVETLAAGAAGVAAAGDLRTALQRVADACADALRADLVVLRVVGADGLLAARAVAPAGSALAAEAAGTRAGCEDAAAGLPAAPTRRAAQRTGAAGVLAVPCRVDERVVGALEAVRVADAFTAGDEALATLAAAQLALALRMLAPAASPGSGRSRTLELAGDALAAGADARRGAEQAVRVAADATGAAAATLWGATTKPHVVASTVDEGADSARAALDAALEARVPAAVDEGSFATGASHVVTLPLGQPPAGALQLFFRADAVPPSHELPALAAFAARTAQALRAGERARDVEEELRRTRALLEVVGAAIARLSLSHTLETAVERITELLGVERVGVYLIEDGALQTAAERSLAHGHELVAERLLELVLGPLRARGAVQVSAGGRDPVLAAARAALRASSQRAALAVPLHVREELIGLLVAYPATGALPEGDVSLLTSLAAQLAVAVQNARLHEQAKDLGDRLGEVLAAERQTSRQVNALYDISRAFAQTLSLDTTLETVTATIVDVLDVDAAVIRVPDERGDRFEPRAVHVAEARLEGAVRTILERPQPRPARSSVPLVLDAAAARRLGGAHALLVPFLEKGSTAALLPISTASELLAELTILSLDPAEPIDAETLTTAATIAQQAALAIDNARLYHQQKLFAETMQQSLLPRERPAVAGLEVGTVYQSAAQVDVGGDVFDFLELADGRLAVVLGDVTGHGIDATADMAMAKFVFRSLAREHPDPSAFLAHANDVVVGEIASGKFITMAYVTVDPSGAVLCASAGHPEPRLVHLDGAVEGLRCGGLALGIDADQEYERTEAALPPGAAVVLYTDGVVEARRGHELFGAARLDALLARYASRPAQEIADAVVTACRRFAGGVLGDDCAIVVIKRTS
ncbi:MAG TPA: GAF domain-containing SpoIIE family protein phosphatase [Gaiellaceae bacterium]|nr:GAF domain-containing SpoIIE family protein phosphatase [Gaiellaceae bacterium]